MSRLSILSLLLCPFVFAGLGATELRAQDSLKLDDGRRVTGEILIDNEEGYVFVTKLGEKLELPRASVVKARKGRGLAKRVSQRLAAVAADDLDGLLGVARWARGQKSLRRDAERLFRRVLAQDSDHAEARKALGHVKMLGTWYLDGKSARKSVRALMKERGLLEHDGGYGPPELIARVDAAPKEWTIDELTLLWRPLAEVMKERGFVDHEGEWYGPDEKDVIVDLELARDVLGLKLRAAGKGATRVIAPFSRKGCAQHAEELERARAFFIKTFRPERRNALMEVRAVFWLVRDQSHFEAFLDKGKGSLHDERPQRVEFSRPIGVLSWDYISQVQSQERGTWKESDVATMGMMMMDREWTGRVACPDWLGIASAHHAEIAVYGAAKTWWVAPSRYGNQDERRTAEGRTLDQARLEVKAILKKRRTPVMRSLFGKKTNQMTVDDDFMGIALMSYFLEKRRDQILEYCYGSIEKDIAVRFEAVFGHSFEEEEKLFRAWLGL